MTKKMKYTGKTERIVPQYGIFKPGDVVNYDEQLHNTGFFTVEEKQKKAGDK